MFSGAPGETTPGHDPALRGEQGIGTPARFSTACSRRISALFSAVWSGRSRR